MPQMAPMSWLILYLLFTLIYIIFNILNYYNFNITPPSLTLNNMMKKKELNWKW